MQFRQVLNKIVKIYMKFEESVLVICLAVMGLVLTAQILLRYFISAPISWAEELARYLQIWITFLGMGYAFRKKSHIALDLLLEKFPKKLSKAITIFNDLVMIVCSAMVIYVAPIFLSQQHKLSSTLHVPLNLVYGVIPIGFGITILYLIADIILKFKTNTDTEGGNE